MHLGHDFFIRETCCLLPLLLVELPAVMLTFDSVKNVLSGAVLPTRNEEQSTSFEYLITVPLLLYMTVNFLHIAILTPYIPPAHCIDSIFSQASLYLHTHDTITALLFHCSELVNSSPCNVCLRPCHFHNFWDINSDISFTMLDWHDKMLQEW